MSKHTQYKSDVLKRYKNAVCHKGKAGWAIYSRRFGYRISFWMPTRLEAWQDAYFRM